MGNRVRDLTLPVSRPGCNTNPPPPPIAPRGGRGERGFGGTKWLQEPLQREGGGDTFKGIWVGSKRGEMVQR